jgi:CheY-like chemotaxis protein
VVSQGFEKGRIVVADPASTTRNLVCVVLRGGGFLNVIHARDGHELLTATEEYLPQIIICTSRLPGLSGLDFTRKIRVGHKSVPRELSIVLMTDTPTKSFVDIARSSGVDEMLVRPFTANGIMLRVRSVIERPRQFVDSQQYAGPCRRRKMIEDYDGPLRRLVDPVDGMEGVPAWEAEPNRAVVRVCVQKIGELFSTMQPGDRRQVRAMLAAVDETVAIADFMTDTMLSGAARSLARYIIGVGAAAPLDAEVVMTHIDAMDRLCVLTSAEFYERQKLVEGLARIVTKRLGQAAAA